MIRIIFGILCVWSAYAPVAAAEELQRFFFTAEERQVLSRQRSQPAGSPSTVAPAPELTVTGTVRRRSGHNTTWINGVPVTDLAPDGSRVLRAPLKSDQVPLQLSDGRQIELKVGQTYNKATGKIRESYQAENRPLPPLALSTGASEKIKTEAGKAAKR